MEHKKVGKLALTSGTWKSNLIMLVVGFLVDQVGGWIGGIIGSGFEIIGVILLLVALLNLVVFSIQAIFKKKS